MARPIKRGLDYFPFDVGFFGSNEIRILKAHYRANGIAVYVKILCDVYGAGYFLPVVDWCDYVGLLADELSISTNAVEQIIAFLQRRAMVCIFRKEKGELTGLDNLDAVITSHGIQKRYAAAMKSRRRKSVDEIKRGFWLLSEEEERELNAFYKCGINEGFYGNNPSFYVNNPNKSQKNDTNKIKENIYTDVPRAKADFFERFPILAKTADGVDDSGIDYVHLLECFNRSKKLLCNRREFSWVVKNYGKIITGAYDDHPTALPSEKPAPPLPANVQAANEKTARERFYARRRGKAITQAEHVKEKAMQNTRFSEAEKELRALELKQVKAELHNPDELPEIEARQEHFKRERAQALFDLGLKESDLSPKWYCPKCSDTGFLEDGKACDCYNP